MRHIENIIYIFLFIFIVGSISFAQNSVTNEYIYDRDVYITPKDVEESSIQAKPNNLPYPFSLGPKMGILAGGMYFDGLSPYLGVFIEMPFTRFLGGQINVMFHQYNLTFENFNWIRPNENSAQSFPSDAVGGDAILNYIEAQIFLKFYIEKFWIGFGFGANIFLNGKIKRWYRTIHSSSPGGGSIIDDIRIFQENVSAETAYYIYFSVGRVTQLTSEVFLFPEVYAHLYAFSQYFLNREWFTIGANLSLGYRF